MSAEFAFTGTIDFGSVPAQGMVEKNVPVVGAVIGAAVLVTPISSPGSILFDGFVSAPGIVTVRATNPTAGAIVVAAATYRILVFVP